MRPALSIASGNYPFHVDLFRRYVRIALLMKDIDEMELELATTEDIVNELLRRQIRFAFVAVENTNSGRLEFACCSGKGADCHEVANLFDMGRDAFQRHDSDGDPSGPTID